jgi:hypothetical protein
MNLLIFYGIMFPPMDCLNGERFLVFRAIKLKLEQGDAFQEQGSEHEQWLDVPILIMFQ